MGGGGEVAEDAAAVVGGVDELALKKYHGAGDCEISNVVKIMEQEISFEISFSCPKSER